MRRIEDENNRLKKVVADLTLGKAMLQDVLSRKLRGLFAVGRWPMRPSGLDMRDVPQSRAGRRLCWGGADTLVERDGRPEQGVSKAGNP
jgi:hypothetical protein